MLPSLKTVTVLTLVVVVAFAGYEAYLLTAQPGSVSGEVPSAFTVNGRTYTFNYTATTQAAREEGLMNRRITNSTTMLFAFPTFGKWSFWMYDTNTSLDMIWLNATGGSARVVYLVTSVPPCYTSSTCAAYTPTSAANYVIEAKAGFATQNDISVGTAIGLG